MDTHEIPGLGVTPGVMGGAMPSYGVGSLRHQRDRRGKRRPFERALGNGEPDVEDNPSVAEDDVPDGHAQGPLSPALQDDADIGRKDEGDGQLHVDIVV